MIQVKVFDEQHEDDLTDSLNEFLAELSENDVLSVELATSAFLRDTRTAVQFQRDGRLPDKIGGNGKDKCGRR